jgi:hypothetical protein
MKSIPKCDIEIEKAPVDTTVVTGVNISELITLEITNIKIIEALQAITQTQEQISLVKELTAEIEINVSFLYFYINFFS